MVHRQGIASPAIRLLWCRSSLWLRPRLLRLPRVALLNRQQAAGFAAVAITTAFVAGWLLKPAPEPEVLYPVYDFPAPPDLSYQLVTAAKVVESSNGLDKRDGDRTKPLCERSIGDYQVKPDTLRDLVRWGYIQVPKALDLTSCAAVIAYLRTEEGGLNGGMGAMAFALDTCHGDVRCALYKYNCGPWEAGSNKFCHRYARRVLDIWLEGRT